MGGMRRHQAAPIPLLHEGHYGRRLDDALAATRWFEPHVSQLEALRHLLPSCTPDHLTETAVEPAPETAGHCRPGAAATLLRRAVFLAPSELRPYFAVCALEARRRVPVRRLAAWSGISWSVLRPRLAQRSLTPAGVAAWNLALHATWLLDVAELPAREVVGCMNLGRSSGLAAVLGARAVRFSAGRVEPGAFAVALARYISVLRAAFRA